MVENVNELSKAHEMSYQTFGTPDPSREKTKAKESSISTSPGWTHPLQLLHLLCPFQNTSLPGVYTQRLLTF